MDSYCEVCDCDPCDCDGMETEDMPKEKKTYSFIRYKDSLYVPRASSFCEARERSEFLEDKFDKEVIIVGPFEWEILSTKMGCETIEVEND